MIDLFNFQAGGGQQGHVEFERRRRPGRLRDRGRLRHAHQVLQRQQAPSQVRLG